MANTSKTRVSSETHAQNNVHGNSMLINRGLHLRGSQLPSGLLGGLPLLLSPPPPLLPPPVTLPPPMPPPPKTACSNDYMKCVTRYGHLGAIKVNR